MKAGTVSCDQDKKILSNAHAKQALLPHFNNCFQVKQQPRKRIVEHIWKINFYRQEVLPVINQQRQSTERNT